MKPKMYLQSLMGISTLFVACNISAAGATTIDVPVISTADLPYYESGLNNATEDMALSIANEIPRIPHYRFGEFVVPPTEVPATDSKGAVVKKVDAKGAMAPSVSNERWEVFVTSYWFNQKVDENITHLVPQSDIEMWGINAGARYRINDAWSVGGMVGYNDTFIDVSAPPLLGGARLGKIEATTWAFTPFVNFEQKNLVAGADFLAQLQYTYGSSRYRNNVVVIPGWLGDRDGYSNMINLTTGLVWTSGDLHHGPVVGVRYIDAHVDAFNLGPVPITASSFESLASILGYELSYDIKLGGGKIVPAVSATWEREYRANYHNIVAGVPNGTLAKDTAVLGAGVGWYGNCGWNVVLDYEARLNSASNSNFVGLKVGKSF